MFPMVFPHFSPWFSENKVVMLVMISTACADAAPGRHDTRHVARDRSNVPRRRENVGKIPWAMGKTWENMEEMEEIMGKSWEKTGVTEHHFTSNGEDMGFGENGENPRGFARLRQWNVGKCCRQELPTLAGDQSGLEGGKCLTESTEKMKKHAEIMTIFDLHGIMLHLSKHVGLVSMVYKFYKTIFWSFQSLFMALWPFTKKHDMSAPDLGRCHG